jgi:hypothetical protein
MNFPPRAEQPVPLGDIIDELNAIGRRDYTRRLLVEKAANRQIRAFKADGKWVYYPSDRAEILAALPPRVAAR